MSKQPEKIFSRCRKCARNTPKKAHTSCPICADTEFDETVLCELNRSAQKENDGFECHAFLPMLEVVGSKRKDASIVEPRSTKDNMLAEQLAVIKLMKSDKVQYQKALALQQLDRDPDATTVNLRFHYAWNVRERQYLFTKSEAYFEQIYDAFSKASIPSVLRAQLLWLAPDHVHVYCEADGDRSVEDIIIDLKSYLDRDLIRRIPELVAPGSSKESLWDEGYFVETIG